MKTNRKVIGVVVVGILLAAVSLGLTAWAKAQEFRTVAHAETAFLAGGPGLDSNAEARIRRALERLGDYLDLSDTQKAQIQAILEAERPKVEPLMRQSLATRQQLLDSTKNGQFDETQVQTIAAAQGQNFAALIVEKERVKTQIYGVLTDAQRARLEKLRGRIEARLRAHFGA